MNVYLSIDLDYWCRSQKRTCDAFFKKVYALHLPIHVAREHHHLLDVINSSRCDTLINVDWHSDLCDSPEDGWTLADFNDGTWGNFVSWRHKGTFIWRYPRSTCLSLHVGYCHDDDNPFEMPVSGWMATRKRRGVADIPWDSVKSVGVCLSPTWIGKESVIQEPITRLEMQEWVKGDWLSSWAESIVKVIPPRGKKQRKCVLSLANRR